LPQYKQVVIVQVLFDKWNSLRRHGHLQLIYQNSDICRIINDPPFVVAWREKTAEPLPKVAVPNVWPVNLLSVQNMGYSVAEHSYVCCKANGTRRTVATFLEVHNADVAFLTKKTGLPNSQESPWPQRS
jgi:hypothetical protein